MRRSIQAFVFAVVAVFTVSAQIPTDSLVAYYPFTGNANDASGKGNNGTVNGAILTTDRFGNANSAYSFNGTNSYIEVADNNTLDLSGDISIFVWIYQSSSLIGSMRILDKLTAGNYDGYLFDTYGGGSAPNTQMRFIGYDNYTLPSHIDK